MTNSMFIFIAIAFAVGALIGWMVGRLWAKASVSQNAQQLLQLNAKLLEMEQERILVQQQRDEYFASAQKSLGRLETMEAAQVQHVVLQGQYTNAQMELSTTKAQLDFSKAKLEQREKDLQEIHAQMRVQFQNLANEILERNSQKFTETNEKRMTEILNPLKSDLNSFKKQVEETYDKESKERFSLSHEVKRLVETTQMIGEEANNLTTALKGNKKQQGNWGEMLLESILEHSGLAKGREYFTQEFIRDAAGNTIRDENGHALQPDVTIYYPDHRKIIIDSKVSLNAWINYTSATDSEAQKASWQQHIQAVRQHVNSLSRKNYPKYAQALDYVIMFVPNEAAFLEALKEEPTLWKEAYDKKILMVSPTNLLAVLKIVADLWRIEQQSQNAIAIAEKAGDLYDKFVGFTENLQDVGKKIGDAQTSYENAFKQLSTGKGNLVRRAEQLKRMGANAKKKMSDVLLNEAEDD